jgi:hypothetical protein
MNTFKPWGSEILQINLTGSGGGGGGGGGSFTGLPVFLNGGVAFLNGLVVYK